MDSKELRELMEAYTQVYAPQEEIEEAVKGADPEMRRAASAERRSGDKRLPPSKGKEYAAQQKQSIAYMDKLTKKNKNVVGLVSKEEVDVFDIVLEFLQVEGYAETLEEAEWMMANVIDEEAIGIILGEAIYSEKGKAKAAEMIAKRSTPSGRAKPGKGDNVAQIRQIRGSGRGDFDKEGLGGTPMTPTMAKNPRKKQNYTGTGNKAARRAGLTPTREKPNAWKEEFELWVNELVEEGYDLSDYTWDEMYDIYEASRRDEFTRAAIARYSGRKGGITFEPGPNWDPSANRGKGAHLSPKQKEKQRRKALRQEEYVDEAQHARENPEKYEREQSKKYDPVRGERTPMPPRGDKRREDFEKWYAKNVR